ncbi:MAG TPA: hypothetical protein VEO73_03495 [Gemmatimonadales bacterium]|nr:hypothetical protein [Gemmatimonadales bacterium]
MNERERFIADYHLDLYPMVELCARYNVSRKSRGRWATAANRWCAGCTGT